MLAWLNLPFTATSTARNFSSVGVDVGALEAGAMSSVGNTSCACMDGPAWVICQPPCQAAVSSPLPAAATPPSAADTPGIDGNCCSQRSASAAFCARTDSSPLPLVLRSSPRTLACMPGAVKLTSALISLEAAASVNAPLSWASRVFKTNDGNASVPPASCAFQLPVTWPSSGSAASWVCSACGLTFFSAA